MTDKTDALVAKCRAHVHACETMRMPATAQLLREVTEALAEQPAGTVVVGEDGDTDFTRWYASSGADSWGTRDAATAAFHAGRESALATPPAASVEFTEQHGKDLRTFADQFNDPAVTETSITRAQWDAIAAFVREQDAIIDSHEESASVDVSKLHSLFERIRPNIEAAPWVCEEISRLIDSAGGAKVDFCSNEGHVTGGTGVCLNCNTPQPDGGEGVGS